MDVRIDRDVLPKMEKLISILDLDILLLDQSSNRVRLLLTNV